MRQWLERRRYHRAVKSAFDWMASGFPDGFAAKLWLRYPGIDMALRDQLAQKTASELAALQIFSAVMTDTVERSSDVDKLRVLNQLKCAKDEQPTDAAALGILRAESIAHHWALAGKFDMNLRDIMMGEIIGALGGIPANQRVANRISQSFLGATGVIPARN